jgi:anti-sigma factor RsiW
MISADPFEDSDAAYVLGMLSDTEREAFEAHLATCDACTERVHQLTRTADLLSDLTEADLLAADDDGAPLPDTLLPALLRQAGVARRRRRTITFGLSGLVAACLIALAVAILPSSSTTARPQAMTAVTTTHLQATAAISERQWGTEITLDCNYPGSTSARTPDSYELTVISDDGMRHSLGSWTVAGGSHTKFTSGTALTPSQLRTVQITRIDGAPVLSLNI